MLKYYNKMLNYIIVLIALLFYNNGSIIQRKMQENVSINQREEM